MNKEVGGKKMRVFFAIWPDSAERNALAAWQAPLKKLCGGRAMRPDTLHLTLVFMGEVAQQRLDELRAAAQEISGEPFELSLDTARYWRHNRIVHAAPEQTPVALNRLAEALTASLRKHGFRLDERRYVAHVTLLRDAKWNETALPPMPAVTWRAREYVLVQSLGGRYVVLARFLLSGQ